MTDIDGSPAGKCVDAYEASTDCFYTHVGLHHTDAVGVLFATSPIEWAQRGFENLLRKSGHPLEDVLSADVHYPIASVRIDHYSPLKLGTRIRVNTYVASVGRKSVKIVSEIVVDSGATAVRVERVGVAVSRMGKTVIAENWLRELAQKYDESKIDETQVNRASS